MSVSEIVISATIIILISVYDTSNADVKNQRGHD